MSRSKPPEADDVSSQERSWHPRYYHANEKSSALSSLGCTVHEAAAILKLAPATVDNHKARAMAKLGTGKAALLTRLAIQLKVTMLNETLTTAEKRKSGRKNDGWN